MGRFHIVLFPVKKTERAGRGLARTLFLQRCFLGELVATPHGWIQGRTMAQGLSQHLKVKNTEWR